MSGPADEQRRQRAGEQSTDARRHREPQPTAAGEVDVHRRVVEEEQTVPVELRREAVQAREERVGDRPVRPGEEVFREGTIRVPVRGEEPVVQQEAVVTGEVVIGGARATEGRKGNTTVRAGRGASFPQTWARFQQRFAQRQGGPDSTTAPGDPGPLEELEAPARGAVRAGRLARVTPWRARPSPVEAAQVADGASSAAGPDRPRSRARWALLGLGLGVLTPLVALALPGVRQALAGTWQAGARQLAGQVAHMRTATATWAAERERQRLRQTVARLERELARCQRQGRR